VPRVLADGVYEHLITASLAEDLGALEPGRDRLIEALDDSEAPVMLARHVAAELTRALHGDGERRGTRRVEVVNALIDELRSLVPELGKALEEVDPKAEQLQAIYRGELPPRPTTPLSSSALPTRGPRDPSLGSELAREIESADRVDILVAFITLGGIRALRPALEALSRRAGAELERLRVLTTVFTGTTEPEAVHALAELPGAKVKVSYDVQRTRLHAKAWLLHRESGLVQRLGAEHFRFVVVDECHHVAAESYQALVPSLQPEIFLGLTATPERSDGRSLLPDFEGHIAAELRLWHALERQLVVPFEYYGISDQTDLRQQA